MKKNILIAALLILNSLPVCFADTDSEEVETEYIFNDKLLISRGTQKYAKYSKEILLAMINDDALPNDYQRAAAVRVFKENYSHEVVSGEKRNIERILLRRLNNTNSPFVQVEIMDTLCRVDRYKYFKSMIPVLIQKLDHYNPTINEMAYKSLNDIIESGHNRSREARIVFDTLRKVLFLSKKRLANMTKPDQLANQKIKLLRWSIKIIGNEELKNLPQEVINLL